MEHALVTGASGFIGGHLVEHLLTKGHRVRAVVRSADKAAHLDSMGAHSRLADITQRSSLQGVCQGIDTVFHLAAYVSDWGPWAAFETAIVRGSSNILEEARSAGVRRFVHFSTVAVYDDRCTRSNSVIPEQTPSGSDGDRTHGYYARAKVRAEELVWQCHQRGDMQVVVLRPAFVYGPRDVVTLLRLVEYLRSPTAAWPGGGNQTVDPIYVTDVVSCAGLAAVSDAAAGQAYNIAPDRRISLREFWTLLCQAAAMPVPRITIPRPIMRWSASVLEGLYRLGNVKHPPPITRAGVAIFSEDRHHTPAKVMNELGWRPATSLEDGIRFSMDWLRQFERSSKI